MVGRRFRTSRKFLEPRGQSPVGLLKRPPALALPPAAGSASRVRASPIYEELLPVQRSRSDEIGDLYQVVVTYMQQRAILRSSDAGFVKLTSRPAPN